MINPYSYHTFLFPFIWKTKPEIKLRDFERIFQAGTNWIERKWEVMQQGQDISQDEKKKNEWFQNYAAYQYFTTAANNAIFNADGKGIVKCYVFNKKNGTYNIHKKDETFILKINQIRLNVYEAGIAIMIFELENYAGRDLDTVNKINEYGRRINFPYLMEQSHTLCADQISVKFDDGTEITEDFLETSKHLQEHIQGDGKVCHCSLNYVMKPVQDILDGGMDNKITSNLSHKDKFLIEPCIDDRMFVCCMVLDEKFSRELQGIEKDGISFLNDTDVRLKKDEGKVIDISGEAHDDYMEGWSDEKTLSSRLYKLLFVENDLSCQENAMKRELLKDCVYRHWLNSGTIHGVTHHSFVAVCNGEVWDAVINPFLTEYVQIAILTLAQRSVLLMLENEASEISNNFGDETDISQEDLKKIERLQEKYVKIQNQILLSEITVQEQGVELYEMLRKQLYIQKNMNDLDGEMNNLRDISNAVNARLERESDAMEENRFKMEEKNFNMIGILLSLLALVEPFAMMIMLYGRERYEGIFWFIISMIVVLGILIYYNRKKRNRVCILRIGLLKTNRKMKLTKGRI
ncbi:MAG: hypothetical protein LUD57_03515 [Ruminococcus sp.]|nr:hypothetical protein [Ruminococcus sp.]